MKQIGVIATIMLMVGCVSVPDVYLIDRHTVMEAEASGEWPELEKRFLEKSISKGPTNLAKEPYDDRKKKAFRVLNDEMVTKTAASE